LPTLISLSERAVKAVIIVNEMSSKKVPIVAIVGRANVGKSSLFNAVLGYREAIVASEPGTTRDSIFGRATLTVDKKEQNFWLVDTAGLKDAEDEFEFTIQEQIAQAADSADVIIVMVEADTIITEDDRRVAKLALKSNKPVLLVANKIDRLGKILDFKHLEKLGIKPIFPTSFTQNKGLEDLLSHLAAILPKASIKIQKDRIGLALLGRPNVGKSALFNALAKKQQAIVADKAGTTRDINRVVVRYEGREIELLDTAGIRRSGKIQKGVEKFSVLRSLSAIEQSDVCLLLMEASELNVQLDQKIAGMIKEAGKGLILVVSKWDDVPEKDAYTRDALAPKIISTYDFVPWAPLVFTSSVTGQNVTKIFDVALEIINQRSKRIATGELNRWLRRAVDSHPPAGLKNRSPKLNYIVQENDNPTPAFKIFGSQTRFLHWSYKRYMERNLREAYGYTGTPVQFWFFDKKGKI
jgi:GTPase